ncbi:MAG: hypothetical protein JKY96_04010, partial [Phycisphaerales bacterium]|nr:hypothetical protein [Phycisphaerales bacterium]
MNDSHPDIKIGEPIPKVEPRIDPRALDTLRSMTRWSRVCFFGLLILLVVVGVLRINLFLSLGIYLAAILIWVIPLVRLKKMTGFDIKDKWSLPFLSNIEMQFYSMSIGVLPMMGTMRNGYSSMFVFIGI